jgi:hypothetical protein
VFQPGVVVRARYRLECGDFGVVRAPILGLLSPLDLLDRDVALPVELLDELVG